MKFSIDRDPLLAALHRVLPAAARGDIPILGFVKIEAAREGDRFRLGLTTCDTEIEIRAAVPPHLIKAATKGTLCVSAHLLQTIVGKLAEGAEVEMEAMPKESRLALRAGRASFALPTLPAEDFPEFQTSEMPVRFDIPAADLSRLFDHTLFAVSREQTRYYLCGIHLTREGDKLAAVATDGHRLARYRVDLPEGAADMPPIILPSRTVGILQRLMKEEIKGRGQDAIVGISLSETKFSAEIGDTAIEAKLIDGTFPEYARVIPENLSGSVQFDVAALRASAERVATIAEGDTRAIRLAADGETLTITARGGEDTKAEDAIEAACNRKGEIGINSRYLDNVLAVVPGGKARLGFESPDAPIRIEQDADPELTLVVMPMRV